MDVPCQIENQICIIAPQGDLVLDGVTQLKNFIMPHLNDPGIRGIAIELTKIRYINSSGIGLMVTIAKVLEERDGMLVLYGANENLYKIFTDTGLHAFLKFYQTKEEALAQFENKKS